MTETPETVELPEPLNDGFDQPSVIDDVLYAFPGHLDRLMPATEAIPREFFATNDWTIFVNRWFFQGWPETLNLYERPDVDAMAAYRHLHTILRSFEPKHEHKIAAVAWLMSRWYAAVRPAE